MKVGAAMAYFLQVKNSNGEYKSLNISKSSRFNSDRITDSYNRSTSYSLQGLDHFTMQFESENELRNHLLLEGILSPNLADRPIVIRFAGKKKVRNYKLFFIDDLEYFYPEILISMIENRYLSNDFRFLGKLAEYFRDFRECGTTASELVVLATKAINTGLIDKGFKELDSNGDIPVIRLSKLLIFKYKMGPYGIIKYNEHEFNWRTLHILIEFIKNYEQKELESSKKTSSLKDMNVLKKEKVVTDSLIGEQLCFKDLPNYE